MLVQLAALDDPTTPGHVLATIAERAPTLATQALVLAHPNTPEHVPRPPLRDVFCVFPALNSPAATPATRARLLAAVPDRVLWDLAAFTVTYHYRDDVLTDLHARGATPDLLARFTDLRPPVPQNGSVLTMIDIDVTSTSTPAALRTFARRALTGMRAQPPHRGTPGSAAARAELLTVLATHPNTPSRLRADLLAALPVAVAASYAAHTTYLAPWHIAHHLTRDPDLVTYIATARGEDLRRNAAIATPSTVLTHTFARHLAPLIRSLWDDPATTTAAFALWDTFPGSVTDFVATVHSITT